MNQSQIRNFCIIAHIDHGKSTLADRMLEITETINKRQMKEQVLDQMELERERGITIKLQPVRMKYQGYILNLIDTPGHVDFTYEVSRSLAAVEGTILLVDASQGIQAQTLAVLYQAIEQDLTIIPVINKIDLPSANPEVAALELVKLLGCQKEEIFFTSGKTGQGISELLGAIIDKIPSPTGDVKAPARLLVFDSKYDSFRGVVAYVRVAEGQIAKGEKIRLIQDNEEDQAVDLGFFIPNMISSEKLSTGEIGFIVTNFKDVTKVPVGDTIAQANQSQDIAPLPGFRQIQPNVYASIYSSDPDRHGQLKDSLQKLKLNDTSLFFESESSPALGLGFRCGFLGPLHLEIVRERLEREFNLDLVTTAPSVSYQVILTNGLEQTIYSPAELPDSSLIERVLEPITSCEVIIPNQYLGKILDLVSQKRGLILTTDYLDNNRVLLRADLPLSEVVVNFFDQLKSLSQGFGSMSYQLKNNQEASVARLDIFVAGEMIKPLSQIVPKSQIETRGRQIVEKLKKFLPRQNFTTALQAVVGGKIIARENISALKKNVTEKLYGGDVTRKMKLIEHQRRGKKRMAKFGKVEIPNNVFLNLFKDL